MKLKVRYEEHLQITELDDIAKDETATSLSISQYETETDKDFEKRIQVEFDNRFNKPEYNIHHRETRHVTLMSTLTGGNIDATNSDEMLYKAVADKEAFVVDINYANENQRKYEAICGNIRKYLKKKSADVVIATVLDGYSIEDYAQEIGEKPNTVSKRLCRAKEKLNKLGKNVLLAGV